MLRVVIHHRGPAKIRSSKKGEEVWGLASMMLKVDAECNVSVDANVKGNYDRGGVVFIDAT